MSISWVVVDTTPPPPPPLPSPPQPQLGANGNLDGNHNGNHDGTATPPPSPDGVQLPPPSATSLTSPTSPPAPPLPPPVPIPPPLPPLRGCLEIQLEGKDINGPHCFDGAEHTKAINGVPPGRHIIRITAFADSHGNATTEGWRGEGVFPINVIRRGPFQATYEYLPVEAWHAVPPGLDVRMPLDGAVKTARIPQPWQLRLWVAGGANLKAAQYRGGGHTGRRATRKTSSGDKGRFTRTHVQAHTTVREIRAAIAASLAVPDPVVDLLLRLPRATSTSQGGCVAAAVHHFGDRVTAVRPGLVVSLVAGWPHLPPGCSVESGGDWAAHWNTRASAVVDGGEGSAYTPVLPIPPPPKEDRGKGTKSRLPVSSAVNAKQKVAAAAEEEGAVFVLQDTETVLGLDLFDRQQLLSVKIARASDKCDVPPYASSPEHEKPSPCETELTAMYQCQEQQAQRRKARQEAEAAGDTTNTAATGAAASDAGDDGDSGQCDVRVICVPWTERRDSLDPAHTRSILHPFTHVPFLFFSHMPFRFSPFTRRS